MANKATDSSSVDLSHTVLAGAVAAPPVVATARPSKLTPAILATFKPGDGSRFEPGEEDALQEHGLTGAMIGRGRREGQLAGAWEANLDDPNFGVVVAPITGRAALPDVGERQLIDGSVMSATGVTEPVPGFGAASIPELEGSAAVRRTAADRAAEIVREEATGTDADTLARKAADKRAAQDRKATAGKRR